MDKLTFMGLAFSICISAFIIGIVLTFNDLRRGKKEIGFGICWIGFFGFCTACILTAVVWSVLYHITIK